MTTRQPTATAFRPELDLHPTLAAVRSHGAARVEHALTDAFLDELRAEADTIPLEPLPSHEGRTRQEGEIHVIHGPADAYPAIHRLRDDLVELVHAHGAEIPGCVDWHPNEISIQRYHPGALGITPHLDLKSYHYLVAIVTAIGEAPFTICRNRDGDPLATWPATAGSLTLLRGPGFNGFADGRPLHAVSGPSTGDRISITFRMDTSESHAA
jgi:hypothetical protein